MRLKNKKIIVTAAAQGIGKSTALTFANEGAEVIALDINKEKIDEISKENPNIKTEVVDATSKSEVERVFVQQLIVLMFFFMLLDLCIMVI